MAVLDAVERVSVCYITEVIRALLRLFFFFFNDTATTEIYTLSLHDALPISPLRQSDDSLMRGSSHEPHHEIDLLALQPADRKSTRLNSSHLVISYAVFCLKKKQDIHIDASHLSYSRIVHPTCYYAQLRSAAV